jgi:hypothetical protein
MRWLPLGLMWPCVVMHWPAAAICNGQGLMFACVAVPLPVAAIRHGTSSAGATRKQAPPSEPRIRSRRSIQTRAAPLQRAHAASPPAPRSSLDFLCGLARTKRKRAHGSRAVLSCCSARCGIVRRADLAALIVSCELLNRTTLWEGC